jgi:hypothetical protein
MKLELTLIVTLAVVLAACGPKGSEPAASNAPEPVDARASEPAGTGAAASATESEPARPAPLSEPKGAIDPKSVEAAGQVVQHYGALIEQGRWTASREYWGNADAAKDFERSFRSDADVHLEMGDLGEPEGAAGSIYVTEPVTFYGKTNAGRDYRRKAEVTLRRVNDVDGSTEVQRRWHIERIEWK